MSISSTFYEQLLGQQIYADLTGARCGAYSGCNFLLSVLVKLGLVLVVKQKLSTTAFAGVKAARKHVDEIDPKSAVFSADLVFWFKKR